MFNFIQFTLDEIWVEHRPDMLEKSEKCDVSEREKAFCGQFRTLLESGAHADVTFETGALTGDQEGVGGAERAADEARTSGCCTEIPAHKAVLCARSEYFAAMFREGSMRESMESVIRTSHDAITFRRMLEFVYSNDVLGLENCAPQELISLLILANEYLLEDLRTLCEMHAAKIISVDNISKLLLLSAGHNASVLRNACARYVTENKVRLAQDPRFRQEIEINPELGLLLFESSLPGGAATFVGEGNSPGTAVADTTLDLTDTAIANNTSLLSSTSGGQSSKRRRLSTGGLSESSTDLNQSTDSSRSAALQPARGRRGSSSGSSGST